MRQECCSGPAVRWPSVTREVLRLNPTVVDGCVFIAVRSYERVPLSTSWDSKMSIYTFELSSNNQWRC